MASTANEIINRAARRLGILAESEALNATAGVDALSQLNEMLHGFGPRGIHYAHTTLAASDTVNVPDELTRCVMIMFCQELAGDYGIEITPVLAGEILDARQSLTAAYYWIPRTVGDRALQSRTSGYGFRIRTGDE